MRLLFDRHLGPSLVRRLADLFPDSQHVDGAGLSTSDDSAIWDYARLHGFVIVSKDKDFIQLSATRGHPPKVISLRIGNCSIAESADLLRRHSAELHTFESRDDKSLLILVS